VPARRVLVPGAAIAQGAGGPRVWIVEAGRAVARPVDVGPAHGEQVEVRSGLNGGESVIVGAPPTLKEGARVRVRG
jgi:multidrug efflux pump subunit AcrA (membrane-fusion protein)